MGTDADQLEFHDLTDLPSIVQEIIAEGLSRVKLADLERAFTSLSSAYREGKKAKTLIQNEQERLLYLAARLPATYAALCKTIGFFQNRKKSLGSLLDLGAGPGTFLMAAYQMGLDFNQATLIEKDPAWRFWGDKLTKGLYPDLRVNWRCEDFEKVQTIEPHDVVVMSYSLGELERKQNVLEKAWEWTKDYLFLIEPGTPAGFSRIREARAFLLEKGARLVAPCPHSAACPMAGSDWCHFSARLPRTSLHRKIKGGELSYEDEKFSYLILAKENHPLPSARIVRRPEKNKGHVRVHVCTQNQLEQKIFSKKQGEIYKQMKNLEWGDYF